VILQYSTHPSFAVDHRFAIWARIEHAVPALRWVPQYATKKWRAWLLHDIVASLALAALAAPEALSYASIAGMPGANGLYSAYTAPIAYAVFGSSPQLVTGPTTLMSVLTLDAMEGTGTWGGKRLVPETPLYIQVASFLAVVVGLQQVLLALIGGASLTALLSAPIISGFTTGSALIIGASQLYKIFGVTKCVGLNGGSCSIQAAIANVFDHFPGMYWQTPVLSLSCIAFLVLWKYALPRFLPKYLRIVGNAAPLLLLIFTGACSVNSIG
jgi:sulfate permease, SulP family